MYYEIEIEWLDPLSPAAQERLAERMAELEPLGWEELGYYENKLSGWKVFFAETALIADVQMGLRQIFLELSQPLPRIRMSAKQEEDWMANFREQFRTQQAAPGWIIAPPWEAQLARPRPGERMIVIEPGMAFGTGLHETTRLCLEMLTACFAARTAQNNLHAEQPNRADKNDCGDRQGWTMIDVGAGSGVLSIAAALLGAARIDAVEIDPQAEENLRLNIELNSCGTKIRPWILNLNAAELEPADLVVCNMLLKEFRAIAAGAVRLIRPGGKLILSGLLESDVPAAKQLIGELGLKITDSAGKGEWCGYLLEPLMDTDRH